MKHRHLSGFTLIELMVVVGIIGLLAAIAIPNFMRAIDSSRQRACLANLNAIQSAKLQWALDQHKGATDTPPEQELFGAGKYIQTRPACRASGTYTIGTVETSPACSVTSHTL